MAMHEITKRTEAKNADGDERVFLPGRITEAEAEEYGLTESTRTTDTASKKSTKTRSKKKS